MSQQLTDAFDGWINEDMQDDIFTLFEKFQDVGLELWMVGGAVRDLAMGQIPHDFDFASNVPLETIKLMFKKVIPTGEDHGTLTVKVNESFFEITRFRKDVATDGRRATISFSDTIQEDLERRDFTINAIAFNPLTGEIVDPFGGMEAIENHHLDFVGDPQTRIEEDHLRALRFIRFCIGRFSLNSLISSQRLASWFDASILSQERINEEVIKIINKIETNQDREFVIEHFKALELYRNFFDDKEVWENVIEQMVDMKSLFPIAYETVFAFDHDWNTITDVLKLSSQMVKETKLFHEIVRNIIHRRTALFFPSVLDFKRIFNEVHKHFLSEDKTFGFVFWIFSQVIEIMVTNCKFSNESKKNLEEAFKQPYIIKHLHISGKDLLELGFKGVEIGDALKSCLKMVWNDHTLNTRNTLIRRAIEWKVASKTRNS